MFEPAHPFDRIAFKRVICPRCEAKPGQWCVTTSGNPATYIHAARLEGIRAAANLKEKV